MRELTNLNFFIKLAIAVALMMIAWLSPEWRFGVPCASLCVLSLCALRVPGYRSYLKGMALLAGLVVVTWTFNLWLQAMPVVEAFPVAANMAARLITTTAAFFFVTETTSPGSILAAASALRLPPIATLVLSLTFGIVPALREDFERIADAQRARGMEIDNVALPTRLRFALARGVPLLVQAIRMAHAISLSFSIYGFDLRRSRTTWRHVGWMVEPRLCLKDRIDDD
jgi:energy-coupling factor transport system permease protein